MVDEAKYRPLYRMGCCKQLCHTLSTYTRTPKPMCDGSAVCSAACICDWNKLRVNAAIWDFRAHGATKWLLVLLAGGWWYSGWEANCVNACFGVYIYIYMCSTHYCPIGCKCNFWPTRYCVCARVKGMQRARGGIPVCDGYYIVWVCVSLSILDDLSVAQFVLSC